MQQQIKSRAVSAARRRSSGGSSAAAEGAYHPDELPPQQSDFDFCNAFWALAPTGKKADHEAPAIELAKDGYEHLMGRMKMGSRTLEELRGVFRERAIMEEDYAKKLTKLSKSPFGAGETGHMERALQQVRSEMVVMAESHEKLAGEFKHKDQQLAEFAARREAARKLQQTAVEKAWKNKSSQESFVYKAKAKYETDAIGINTLNAQATLSQGRELDKVVTKLDKARQGVVTNQKEYEQYVKVLKETTASWNMQWKTYCDLCQDQEEERLDFVKAKMWDWANALSAVAMTEDESAERTRVALEQCDPQTDLQVFVHAEGTGHDIPGPPSFVDASRRSDGEGRLVFKRANFTRSSTRIPGAKHAPSAVEDITRAIGSANPPPPPPAMEKRQSNPMLPVTLASIPTSHSSSSLASTPNLESAHSPRPPLDTNGSTTSSRFAVSPAANSPSRGSTERPLSTGIPPTARAGQLSAAAFQSRRGAVTSTYMAPLPQSAQQDNAHVAPPEHLRRDSAAGEEVTDDDPIMSALHQLSSSTTTTAGRRGSTGPMAGAVPLPGMSVPTQEFNRRPSSIASDPRQPQQQQAYRNQAPPPQQQQQQQYPSSPQHYPSPSSQSLPQQRQPATRHQSNQSLGRASSEAHGRPASRPTSPAPMATLMRTPSRPEVPVVVSQYGQAFPNERSHSRSGSRQEGQLRRDSYSNGPTLQSPAVAGPPRTASPKPFAGVGAGGRASPQPYSNQPPPNGYGQTPPPHQYAQLPPHHQQQQQQPPPQQYAPPPNQYNSQPQLAAIRPTSPLPFSNSSPAIAADGRRGAISQLPPADARRGSQYGSLSGQPQGYPQASYQSQAPPQHVQQHQSPYQSTPQSQYQQTPQLQYQQSPASFGHGQQPSPAPSHYASPQIYAQPPQQYSQPPPQQQQQQQQQQQYNSVGRAASSTSSYAPPHQAQTYSQQPQQPRMPSPAPSTIARSAGGSHPPTGQYTEDGKPIKFYVNALYNYEASGPDEFSFSAGDVIAVTETADDGWWQGRLVGVPGGGHVFPYNFVEEMP